MRVGEAREDGAVEHGNDVDAWVFALELGCWSDLADRAAARVNRVVFLRGLSGAGHDRAADEEHAWFSHRDRVRWRLRRGAGEQNGVAERSKISHLRGMLHGHVPFRECLMKIRNVIAVTLLVAAAFTA